ncbi:MAG TPA: hypothetical protein P5123_05515 [Spirochaetota bacterium]|nr:hypothetical protein [Spirochaetota bacterium]
MNHFWKTKDGKPKVLHIIAGVSGGIIVACIFAFVFSFAVQYLWNWLLTDLFGLSRIDLYQSFGLVILAKILFGGFGHGHHHKPYGDQDSQQTVAVTNCCGECSCYDDVKENWVSYSDFWQEEGRVAWENFKRKKDTTNK